MTLVRVDPQLIARRADEVEAAVTRGLTAAAAAAAERVAAASVTAAAAQPVAALSVTAAAGDEPPGEPFVSVDDLVIIGSKWNAIVDGVLVPLLEQVYLGASVAWTLALKAGSRAWDIAVVPAVTSQTALDYLAQTANRLRRIGDDLWLAAREQLLEGFQEGESIPELAARVRAAAGITSERRGVTIARTEVISASNAGSIETARLLGIEMTKRWEATNDARTRATHREAHGQEQPLDEPFRVGGAPLQFPGDPTAPAEEVINCRCTIVYDVPEPDAEAQTVTAGAAATLVPPGDGHTQFHLPGRHNQKTHGNRHGKPGGTALPDVVTDVWAFGVDGIPEPTGNMTMHGTSDDTLLAILKRQGFNGPVEQVDDAMFEALLKDGWTGVYRGNKDAEALSAEDMAADFVSGESSYVGRGIYGNGHYFATDRDAALEYAGGKQSGMIELALRPDARVAKYDELDRDRIEASNAGSPEYRAALDRVNGLWEKSETDPSVKPDLDAAMVEWRSLADEKKTRELIMRDTGRYAAMSGVDVIQVDVDSSVAKGQYMIVLNKNAVVSRRK